MSEAEQRAAQGYRELVVTGVLVGAYGQDGFRPVPGAALPRVDLIAHGASAHEAAASVAPPDQPRSMDLADCLLRLARVPGIERVRLSSIEPTQVTDRLLAAFEAEPKLCRHLHIPLQSGDSGVLRAMNRPYDQQFYLDRCREAYRRIPDLAVTSDIMVGFPGEDRAAFQSTIDVVQEVGYARAHLFRYSPRPNTPAADFANQVSDQEKEARSKELAAVCAATQRQFITRFLGRTLDVLVEGKEGAAAAEHAEALSGNDAHEPVAGTTVADTGRLLAGYTSNYIRVEFTGGAHLVGTVTPVTLLEASGSGAVGEAGGAHFGPLEAPPDANFIPLAAFSGRLPTRL